MPPLPHAFNPPLIPVKRSRILLNRVSYLPNRTQPSPQRSRLRHPTRVGFANPFTPSTRCLPSHSPLRTLTAPRHEPFCPARFYTPSATLQQSSAVGNPIKQPTQGARPDYRLFHLVPNLTGYEGHLCDGLSLIPYILCRALNMPLLRLCCID